MGTLGCVSLTRHSEASYRRCAAGKYTWRREHRRTSRQRLKHRHGRLGSGSPVRVRHSRSRGVQAGLGGALRSPRPGLSPTREEGVQGPSQPWTQRLGEPGPHSTSGVGGARPALRMPRTGVRPSFRRGAPRGPVRRAAGFGARRRRDRRAEARAGREPGREVFTVGSARRRSSSARFGLLHYCFRPQRRRPRRRRQPRARPRPLPPRPSREGFWGEARGGTVNGKAARQRGGCGLSFSPPASTPRPGLGLSRDSASLGRISQGSPAPGDS